MVSVQRFVLEGSDTSLCVIGMPDRRTAAQRGEQWMLQNQVRARGRSIQPVPLPPPPTVGRLPSCCALVARRSCCSCLPCGWPCAQPCSHSLVSCHELSYQVEHALYGQSGGGSVYRLLHRESLSQCPLALKRSSVNAGLVTTAEYEQLIKELEAVSPIESRGRIRNVTLLSVSVATKLAHALGRGPKTIAFLRALSTPLPRLWEAQVTL